MQARNIEPRRFWRHSKHRPWLSALSDVEGAIEECRTCGAHTPLGEWRGEWFCRDCLDIATQSYLDPDYDDLGVAG